jgi:hypothetical protein
MGDLCGYGRDYGCRYLANLRAAASNSAESKRSRDDPARCSHYVQHGVSLVLVPVVRDSHGHAIATLHKEDFQLLEKGKPQVIAKLSIEKAEAPPPLPDTSIETDGDGNPQSKSAGMLAPRPIAVLFVLRESFEPGSRAAIFTTSGETRLDFTDDRDKLDRTLDLIRPWPIFASGVVECPDISITRRTQSSI